MRARELLDCGTRRITDVPSALPRQAGVLRDRGAHRHLACSEVTSSRGPVWCRDPAAAPASAFLLLLLLLLRHILTVSAASAAAVVNTSTAAAAAAAAALESLLRRLPPGRTVLLPLRLRLFRAPRRRCPRCSRGASAAAAFFVAASVKWYGLPPCRASAFVGRLSWRASLRNTV